MLTPQTHEATMKEEGAPQITQPTVVDGAVGGVRGGRMGVVVGGPLSYGKGGKLDLRGEKSFQTSSAQPANSPQQYDRLEQYAKLEAAAEGKELGDCFEDNRKESIKNGKSQSALVPILQSRIEAEKVRLWTANSNQRPLRALWIKNASGQTLDSGTFNIIDSGTFAGEGLIETVHADERGLLSYAADTAVRVTAESEFKNQPVSQVRIAKGVVFISREQRNKVKYTVRNSDTASRQVVVEHPVREGWKLVEANKPEETSATHYRFRVAVEPSKTSELTVEEFHPDETRSQLTDITDNQVDVLAVENRMTPALEQAFRGVLDHNNRIGTLKAEINSRQKELNAINLDQARIRDDMKALKGSAEEKALLQRYTKQLDSQEDRLNTLNKEMSDLQQKQAQEQQKLEEIEHQITLDESF